MAKIKGAKRHLRRLRGANASVRRHAGRAIFVGAGQIETEARQSIIRGAIQGAGHVPSRPGEPPNRDTGNLDQNIVATKTGDLTAEVSSNAQAGDYSYSVGLEFGTSKMDERPYMRPAAKKKRAVVRELVMRGVDLAWRRS